MPPGRVEGESVMPAQLTVMEYAWSPVQPAASVAVTVKVEVPTAVGVPERRPLELR